MVQAAARKEKDRHRRKMLSARIPHEMHEELVVRADADRRSMSQFLELLFEGWLKDNPRKPVLSTRYRQKDVE